MAGWVSTRSGAPRSLPWRPSPRPRKKALTDRLARYFVEAWGAPNIDAARPVAAEEIRHMAEMCSEQAQNALMVIERELSDAGVKERFRIVPPQGASLEAFAVHGD